MTTKKSTKKSAEKSDAAARPRTVVAMGGWDKGRVHIAPIHSHHETLCGIRRNESWVDFKIPTQDKDIVTCPACLVTVTSISRVLGIDPLPHRTVLVDDPFRPPKFNAVPVLTFLTRRVDALWNATQSRWAIYDADAAESNLDISEPEGSPDDVAAFASASRTSQETGVWISADGKYRCPRREVMALLRYAKTVHAPLAFSWRIE